MSKCRDTDGCNNEATIRMPYSWVCSACYQINLKSWNERSEENQNDIRREWRMMGVSDPFAY